MIEEGAYFSINKARQYGKTTVLYVLRQYLQPNYIVVSIDFQFLSQESFINEYSFTAAFANQFVKSFDKIPSFHEDIMNKIKDCAQNGKCNLGRLFEYLSDLCANTAISIVLLIDEVDSASNNQVFLDFLAQLRGYYMHREERPTFQSVILAGVYDIKNLKHKMHSDSLHKVNSPWNIATKLNIDLSFSKTDIEHMLMEYEQDSQTLIDISYIAQVK